MLVPPTPLTRRHVLQGFAAAVAGAGLSAVAGPATAAGAAVARMTGPGTVRYEDLYRPGQTLQQVIQAVPSGNILTFPEGEFTFRDFASPVARYEGIRITPNCRGIAGCGRTTVFKMVPYSSTKASVVPSQSQGGTNPLTLMKIANVNNAVLANFALVGTPQGHLYNGLSMWNGTNALLDGLYLQGASPGNWHSPPGETASIGFNHTAGTVFRNSEVDGRNPAGTRVCASPMNWVSCQDVTVQNVYAHHSLAGTCSFYDCHNVTTTDLRSEYNATGSGGLSGSGLNHENVTGRVRHTRPSLIIDRASGNTGLHFNLMSGVGDNPDVVLTDVRHDTGPSRSGCFSVMISDGYHDPYGRTQKQRTLPTITRAGVTLTPIDAKKGTGGAVLTRNYIWYH
jgi:hypothetical protein